MQNPKPTENIDYDEMKLKIERVLEKNRRYPRVVIEQPAEMIPESGDIFRVIVYDISSDGVQLRCDPVTATRINVEGESEGDGAGTLHLRVSVPLKEGRASIKLLGQAVWKKQIAEHDLAVGVRITDIMGGSAARLQRFIEQSLEPR